MMEALQQMKAQIQLVVEQTAPRHHEASSSQFTTPNTVSESNGPKTALIRHEVPRFSNPPHLLTE